MKNKIIVEKLIGYTEKIQKYCDGMNQQQFFSDIKTVEACVFNLSQMGELAHRLDAAFTEKHTEIPWYSIYNLRNRIVHDYEGVNLNLIWEIIDSDLPELLTQLRRLLEEEEKQKA